MMLVVGGNVWLLNVGGLQHQEQEQLTKLRWSRSRGGTALRQGSFFQSDLILYSQWISMNPSISAFYAWLQPYCMCLSLFANRSWQYLGWTRCKVEDDFFLIRFSFLVGFVIFPPSYICIYSLEILTCVSFPLPHPLSCDSSNVSLWGKINSCFSICFIIIIVSFAIVRNTWAQIIRNPNHRHYKSAPPLISPLSARSAWFPLVLNIQSTPFPNLC